MGTTSIWGHLKPDEAGLVVAVVQDDATDQVLMVGYMNEEALSITLARRRVCFWSRSRQALWEKGETSGNTLHLRSIRVDCDGDALLVRAAPVGPTCHTGTTSCFFRTVEANETPLERDDGPSSAADHTLARVFEVILDRQAGRGATNKDGKSYVLGLLTQGAAKITAKIREEAQEACEALTGETPERVASETADLMFHAMIGLAFRGVHLRDVAAVFAKRLGMSGVDEKAARSSADPTT